MEENKASQQQSQPAPARKNRTPIFIVILAILLTTVGFFVWQNQKLETERERQEKELSDTYLKLDSVSNELDQRIVTIQELGGEIDTLVALKEQLEEDKRQLLTRESRQREQITKLNDRVAGYRELLLIKDEEIGQLKQINNQLTEENTTLKVEKNELNQSIRQLQENTEDLEEKVAIASQLNIEGMKVFAVNANGREREGSFRNRHIAQLKIQFTVMDNEVAPIEGKELLLRVIAPDANVLFDVTRGSGSFAFEGRELFYTAKQEILYDKNSQLVTYLYDKGSEYAKGEYKVEIYTDDYLMGQGGFTVK